MMPQRETLGLCAPENRRLGRATSSQRVGGAAGLPLRPPPEPGRRRKYGLRRDSHVADDEAEPQNQSIGCAELRDRGDATRPGLREAASRGVVEDSVQHRPRPRRRQGAPAAMLVSTARFRSPALPSPALRSPSSALPSPALQPSAKPLREAPRKAAGSPPQSFPAAILPQAGGRQGPPPGERVSRREPLRPVGSKMGGLERTC